MERKLSLSGDHAPKAGLTTSTRETENGSVGMIYFSLGRNTDISAGCCPGDVFYLGNFGSGELQLRNAIGEEERLRTLTTGTAMLVRKNTLCSMQMGEGFIYTEMISGKGITMNEQARVGEVLRLSDLLSYEKGSVVNMDVASNPNMKLVVMAFDADTELLEYNVPEDALIFALEGEGEIAYEGTPHSLKAGDQFRMTKGG